MDNVYTAVKPFYFLTKAFGLFPLSFEGPTVKGILRTKLSDVISTSLSFSSFIALCYARISDDIGLQNPTLSAVAWEVTFAIVMLSLLVHFVLQIYKRNDMKKFLYSLHNFDNEVRIKNLD